MAWLLRKPPVPCHRGGGTIWLGGGGCGGPCSYIYEYVYIIYIQYVYIYIYIYCIYIVYIYIYILLGGAVGCINGKHYGNILQKLGYNPSNDGYPLVSGTGTPSMYTSMCIHTVHPPILGLILPKELVLS